MEESSVADLHIVVTSDALILVRDATATFREFQVKFPGFKTSLGPMGGDTLLDTFEDEWPDVLVINQYNMKAFIGDASPTAVSELKLDIRGASPDL